MTPRRVRASFRHADRGRVVEARVQRLQHGERGDLACGGRPHEMAKPSSLSVLARGNGWVQVLGNATTTFAPVAGTPHANASSTWRGARTTPQWARHSGGWRYRPRRSGRDRSGFGSYPTNGGWMDIERISPEGSVTTRGPGSTGACTTTPTDRLDRSSGISRFLEHPFRKDPWPALGEIRAPRSVSSHGVSSMRCDRGRQAQKQKRVVDGVRLRAKEGNQPPCENTNPPSRKAFRPPAPNHAPFPSRRATPAAPQATNIDPAMPPMSPPAASPTTRPLGQVVFGWPVLKEPHHP